MDFTKEIQNLQAALTNLSLTTLPGIISELSRINDVLRTVPTLAGNPTATSVPFLIGGQRIGLSTDAISAAFGGRVDPNATSASLPSGWSVSVDGSTKVYTITHNLGTTAYKVLAVAIDSNGLTYFHPFTNYYANTFEVEFDTAAAAAGLTDWVFMLVLD